MKKNYKLQNTNYNIRNNKQKTKGGHGLYKIL